MGAKGNMEKKQREPNKSKDWPKEEVNRQDQKDFSKSIQR